MTNFNKHLKRFTRLFFNLFATNLVLFSIVECYSQDLPSYSFVMPTIFWDPRNPIFNCPSRGVNTINLRLNDYIRLACPKPGRFIDWHDNLNVPHNLMYENAFITTNETAMDHCTANSSWLFLLKCSDPVNTNIYRTVRIAQHSGSDADPLFTYNTTYYVFATATGNAAGLENRVGGRCNSAGADTYRMKLKLRVCAEGEAGTKDCPVCMTGACYINDCGVYGAWNDTKYYRDVTNLRKDESLSVRKNVSVVKEENKCFAREKRVCNDYTMGCKGDSTRSLPVPCPSVEVEPIYTNCTPLVSELFRDLSGSCLNISRQNCTIGSLEKFQVTRWYKNVTSCPPTTLPPTATLPTICSEWRDLAGIYRNGTSGCFRFQNRQCEYCRKNTTELQYRNATCPVEPTSTAISSSTSSFTGGWTSSSLCPEPTTVPVTQTVTVTHICTQTKIFPAASSSVVSGSLAFTLKPSHTVSTFETVSTLQTASTSSPLSTSATAVRQSVYSPSSKASVQCMTSTQQPCPSPTPIQCTTPTTVPCKCDAPDSGQRAGGVEEGTDYKTYVIPIASALFGCCCGAISVWLYRKRELRLRSSVNGGSTSTEMTSSYGELNDGYKDSLPRHTSFAVDGN